LVERVVGRVVGRVEGLLVRVEWLLVVVRMGMGVNH
jgi:hypothetical protein